MNKFLSYFLKVVLALFAILVILQILLSLFGDYYVSKWLKEKTQSSSQQLYSFSYDDLDLNLFTLSAEFHNVHFESDTSALADTASARPTIINGNSDEIEISGIDVWDYLVDNAIGVGTIYLNKPAINIIPAHHKPDMKESSPSFSTVDSTVYAAFSSTFNSLSIGLISIQSGDFVAHKKDAIRDTSMWAKNVDLTLRDIRIDSSSAQSKRLFPTADVECRVGLFGRHISGDLYSLMINNFFLSSDDHLASADSIQFLPRYPRYAFSRHHGTQIDRISLVVPKVKISGIDMDRGIYKNHFYAKMGKIDHPRLEVFHDKSMPSPPPHGSVPLPHVTFKHMRTKIRMDSLAISDGYISYAEQKANLNKPGHVYFDQISASFSGISNYEEDVTNEHVVRIKTTSRVMGQGKLRANFIFPMGDNDGQHHINGWLGAMPATAFNEATKNIAMVQFTSGILHYLNFSMDVNTYGATGSLTADYEDFKIKILKEDGREAKGTKKLKSFLANTFMVRGSNHDHPLGEAAIRFKRKEPKSIFNLWWKGLLSGLKEQFDTI